MHTGYVKLWRKVLNSDIFNDSDLFKLWALCLMKASHKKHNIIIGRQHIELLPGQFATGRFELYSEFYPKKKKNNVSDKTLWRWLEKLKDFGMIELKTSNKFTIVSIINWSTYQQDDISECPTNVQQMSNKCPTNVQQMSTYKNDKNDKNGKNGKEIIPDEQNGIKFIPENMVPEKVDPSLWKDFLDIRKRLKAPNTERAIAMLTSKLKSLDVEGHNPQEVVENSVMNGWKGVFPLKDFGRNKQKNNHPYAEHPAVQAGRLNPAGAKSADNIARWMERKQREMEEKNGRI